MNTLQRDYFEALCGQVFPKLVTGEHLLLELQAESSQFVRLNGYAPQTEPSGRIRQIGTVADASVTLTLVLESSAGSAHKAVRAINLTGVEYEDRPNLLDSLHALQIEAREIPADPFVEIPVSRGESTQEKRGNLIPVETASEELLAPLKGLDIAGIYASGPSVRAMADSAGSFHWFSTDTYCLDYSLYTPGQRAVKESYAGQSWDPAAFKAQVSAARKKLELLEKPAKRLERGEYRTYLAPAAFAELVGMFSWGTISEAAIRQGDSSLQKVRSGEARFSPLFSLTEDFRNGAVPRFNSEGELAPEFLPLIEKGQLKSTLVSTRTAKEYNLTSNFAAEEEVLRSPAVGTGRLREQEILERLGTGLYISNLHYLNWSDQHGGRITGMTRYACLWVENGKMVCPIENMRFDDTIFRLFGDALEDLGEKSEFMPETSTYEQRSLGGIASPGALLSSMRFTI